MIISFLYRRLLVFYFMKHTCIHRRSLNNILNYFIILIHFWVFPFLLHPILLFQAHSEGVPGGRTHTSRPYIPHAYMIPGGCLALTPTCDILKPCPPPIIFFTKNGKIWPKNGIFLKFFGQPSRFSQICCKISWNIMTPPKIFPRPLPPPPRFLAGLMYATMAKIWPFPLLLDFGLSNFRPQSMYSLDKDTYHHANI